MIVSLEKQEQQVAKQAELAELQQQAKGVAEKQEELNKKIEQFKKDDKAALDKANAQAPAEKQQQNIVKELEKNQVQQAVADQNQAAQQLASAHVASALSLFPGRYRVRLNNTDVAANPQAGGMLELNTGTVNVDVGADEY